MSQFQYDNFIRVLDIVNRWVWLSYKIHHNIVTIDLLALGLSFVVKDLTSYKNQCVNKV